MFSLPCERRRKGLRIKFHFWMNWTIFKCLVHCKICNFQILVFIFETNKLTNTFSFCLLIFPCPRHWDPFQREFPGSSYKLQVVMSACRHRHHHTTPPPVWRSAFSVSLLDLQSWLISHHISLVQLPANCGRCLELALSQPKKIFVFLDELDHLEAKTNINFYKQKMKVILTSTHTQNKVLLFLLLPCPSPGVTIHR